MTTPLMRDVDARSRSALVSGALQPIESEQTELDDGELRFIVRWVSTLAKKDKDGAAVAIPGGPRDPNFNPFLSPDPALTVGPLGDAHTVILNKFPVCARHLVIARREFAEQLSPLELVDFIVLAQVLTESGGLGFYNGGTAAGASQRHKHVQWTPPAPGNASLQPFLAKLPAHAAPLTVARHPAYAMQHCFVRVDCAMGASVGPAAQSLLAAYGRALEELQLRPDAQGLLPPFNLLVGDGWMLVVPRSQELYEGISISALAYGCVLYVRNIDQVAPVRAAGPLKVLAAVGC